MRHRHLWSLVSRSLSGWATYQCTICGQREIGLFGDGDEVA